MLIPALFLFIIAAGTLLLLTSVIAAHFFRYGVQKDKSRVIALVFVAGSILFLSVSSVLFFSIPWNDLLELISAPHFSL